MIPAFQKALRRVWPSNVVRSTVAVDYAAPQRRRHRPRSDTVPPFYFSLPDGLTPFHPPANPLNDMMTGFVTPNFPWARSSGPLGLREPPVPCFPLRQVTAYDPDPLHAPHGQKTFSQTCPGTYKNEPRGVPMATVLRHGTVAGFMDQPGVTPNPHELRLMEPNHMGATLYGCEVIADHDVGGSSYGDLHLEWLTRRELAQPMPLRVVYGRLARLQRQRIMQAQAYLRAVESYHYWSFVEKWRDSWVGNRFFLDIVHNFLDPPVPCFPDRLFQGMPDCADRGADAGAGASGDDMGKASSPITGSSSRKEGAVVPGSTPETPVTFAEALERKRPEFVVDPPCATSPERHGLTGGTLFRSGSSFFPPSWKWALRAPPRPFLDALVGKHPWRDLDDTSQAKRDSFRDIPGRRARVEDLWLDPSVPCGRGFKSAWFEHTHGEADRQIEEESHDQNDSAAPERPVWGGLRDPDTARYMVFDTFFARQYVQYDSYCPGLFTGDARPQGLMGPEGDEWVQVLVFEGWLNRTPLQKPMGPFGLPWGQFNMDTQTRRQKQIFEAKKKAVEDAGGTFNRRFWVKDPNVYAQGWTEAYLNPWANLPPGAMPGNSPLPSALTNKGLCGFYFPPYDPGLNLEDFKELVLHHRSDGRLYLLNVKPAMTIEEPNPVLYQALFRAEKPRRMRDGRVDFQHLNHTRAGKVGAEQEIFDQRVYQVGMSVFGEGPFRFELGFVDARTEDWRERQRGGHEDDTLQPSSAGDGDEDSGGGAGLVGVVGSAVQMARRVAGVHSVQSQHDMSGAAASGMPSGLPSRASMPAAGHGMSGVQRHDQQWDSPGPALRPKYGPDDPRVAQMDTMMRDEVLTEEEFQEMARRARGVGWVSDNTVGGGGWLQEQAASSEHSAGSPAKNRGDEPQYGSSITVKPGAEKPLVTRKFGGEDDIVDRKAIAKERGKSRRTTSLFRKKAK